MPPGGLGAGVVRSLVVLGSPPDLVQQAGGCSVAGIDSARIEALELIGLAAPKSHKRAGQYAIMGNLH